MSEDCCAFCDESRSAVLERHHLLPKRFDGPNTEENLVTLCANCHRVLESIYDEEFWEAAGPLLADYWREDDLPYVSEFTQTKVCIECRREYNARIEEERETPAVVGDPKSPLYMGDSDD